MAEKKVVQRAENIVKIGTRSYKIIEGNINSELVDKFFEITKNGNAITKFNDDLKFLNKGIELAYEEQSRILEKADEMGFDAYMASLETLFEREENLKTKIAEKANTTSDTFDKAFESIDMIINATLGKDALEATNALGMDEKLIVLQAIIDNSKSLKKALMALNASK